MKDCRIMKKDKFPKSATLRLLSAGLLSVLLGFTSMTAKAVTSSMLIDGTTVSDLSGNASGAGWNWNASSTTLTLGAAYPGANAIATPPTTKPPCPPQGSSGEANTQQYNNRITMYSDANTQPYNNSIKRITTVSQCTATQTDNCITFKLNRYEFIRVYLEGLA